MQEKIDFFLLTAHELRTSLSAMKWLFKMLADGDYGALNDEQRTAITQAMQANDRMVATLNNTILAVKDTDAITYTHLPVQLDRLLSEITKEFGSEAAEKHLTLTYHAPTTPITIIGDESKLRMAFHNVIENSLKYSNGDTEVTVSLSADDQAATVHIQDHGIGIQADQLPHVFEKFFRGANHIESGTGLGLYGTKLIIERQCGTITIESQEAVGTTVTISLPLQG
ncbi:MAG: integral rane sensor signal transduction histidine kinase [Candidatus Nomurabacteria bacterium]|jgi:signal transduction histidine kinase|nr:integral rane sensor signal transduction histidine kinase [Candidatus Nomurabacteria bacterium]